MCVDALEAGLASGVALSLGLTFGGCKTLSLSLWWAALFPSYRTLASTMCVCVDACFHIVLHVFGVSGILFTHLGHMLAWLSLFVSCLNPLFASVGQASARIIDSLTWSFVHVSIDS